MKLFDTKGALVSVFRRHAGKHASGAEDAVALAASQITSGRFGKSRLEWTAGKRLVGAGAGVDPTEKDDGDFSADTLVIENRISDPAAPANGRMWLRTDL